MSRPGGAKVTLHFDPRPPLPRNSFFFVVRDCLYIRGKGCILNGFDCGNSSVVKQEVFL